MHCCCIMLKAYTFICMVLCLMTGESFCIDVLCGPIENPTLRDRISIIIYKGNSTRWFLRSSVQDAEGAIDNLNPAIPSILYIHGFMENSESSTVQSVVSAYLHRGDVNVLALDWGQIAGDLNYYFVSKQVPSVGKTVADLLTNLSSIIDLRRLHIIGHSLGAHVAGYIARNIDTNIDRITGLDPAFPLFYPSSCHIQPSDAKVVSILHTDGGIFGTPASTGTVDFYANHGVRPQPGCLLFGDNYCSHQMSVRLFAESIVNPRTFPAKNCINGISDSLETDGNVFYNDSTSNDVRGAYCFTTSANPSSRSV